MYWENFVLQLNLFMHLQFYYNKTSSIDIAYQTHSIEFAIIEFDIVLLILHQIEVFAIPTHISIEN